MKEFKELLDLEHQWPCEYMFKIIVSPEQVDDVKQLWPDSTTSTRPSNNGKYIAVTMTGICSSSDEVISIYEEAGKIEGAVVF